MNPLYVSSFDVVMCFYTVRLGELEKECESLRLDREELTTSLSVATSRVDQSISRAYPGFNLGLFTLDIVL